MTFHDKDRKFKEREQIKFPETIKKRAQSVFKMIFFFLEKEQWKLTIKCLDFSVEFIYLLLFLKRESNAG